MNNALPIVLLLNLFLQASYYVPPSVKANCKDFYAQWKLFYTKILKLCQIFSGKSYNPQTRVFLKIAIVLEESYRIKLVPMVAVKDSVSDRIHSLLFAQTWRVHLSIPSLFAIISKMVMIIVFMRIKLDNSYKALSIQQKLNKF